MIDRYLERTEFSSYEDFYANYKVNIPENFNFGYDIVDKWAETQPDKQALVWCNDNNEERRFTFSQMSEKSNRIANMLLDLGIKAGDKVLLILKQRYEYWFVAVALHKIGAILIPGSVQLTKKDIEYRRTAADIKMIIAYNEDHVPDSVQAACPTDSGVTLVIVGDQRRGFLNFSDYKNYPSQLTERHINKVTDPMLMYFTSGTTGMPKMVVHDYSYPLGHITTAKYWQRVQEDMLHLTVSDSGWAKFGWGKIYGQWIAGATIMAYDMERFVPHNLLSVIEKYKVTTFCAPPTMYRFFIKEDLSKYNLSSIKYASIAGEPLSPEVFKQFLNATGIELREGFGQSESSVFLANFQWFDVKPGSTGKPSPLYDIDIVDEQLNSVAAGEEGEVIIREGPNGMPPGLLCGYYEDGKTSFDCFDGGIYHTGDVCWRDHDGYYWFVGRMDDVIKCSGYRIGPFEVESAVLEHPSVLECAVTAAPDPIRGQIVKATVVLIKSASPSPELVKEIQDHVKKTTAPYKYPRIVEFVDELPKTIGGKIKRAQIRKGN